MRGWLDKSLDPDGPPLEKKLLLLLLSVLLYVAVLLVEEIFGFSEKP